MIQCPPVAGSGSAHEVFFVGGVVSPCHLLAGRATRGGVGIASMVGVIHLAFVYDVHSALDGLLSRLYKICYRS
jgi:hypothetical protein